MLCTLAYSLSSLPLFLSFMIICLSSSSVPSTLVSFAHAMIVYYPLQPSRSSSVPSPSSALPSSLSLAASLLSLLLLLKRPMCIIVCSGHGSCSIGIGRLQNTVSPSAMACWLVSRKRCLRSDPLYTYTVQVLWPLVRAASVSLEPIRLGQVGR